MRAGSLLHRAPVNWLCAVAIVLTPTVASGQDAGYLAAWNDCEIRSAYLESTRETEAHLALQAAGSSGLMTVVLTARFRGRTPTVAPAEVAVRVSAGYQTNPAAIRSPVLTFVVDEDTEDEAIIDLSGRLVLPFPFPGAAIDSATATMSLVEFIQMARAKTIAGEVLGLDVRLTDAQLDAIWRFAETILPKSRRR